MQYQLKVPVGSQISREYTLNLLKTFMDTMKLFMAIPDRIKFPPIGQVWMFFGTDIP